MGQKIIFAAVLFMSGLLIAASFAGAEIKGSGPDRGKKMFDTASLRVYKGTIVKIDKAKSPMPGGEDMLVVILKTDTGIVSINLGPKSRAEKKGVKLNAKDEIEIKGITMEFGKKSEIMAVELKKQDVTIKLMDDKGPAPGSHEPNNAK